MSQLTPSLLTWMTFLPLIGAALILPVLGLRAAGVLVLLTASPLAGAAVGLAFGLSRGLPVLATAGVDTPGRLWSFQRRFQAREAAARWATAASLGALAAAGAWTLAVRR